jgi:hypothetical protein
MYERSASTLAILVRRGGSRQKTERGWPLVRLAQAANGDPEHIDLTLHRARRLGCGRGRTTKQMTKHRLTPAEVIERFWHLTPQTNKLLGHPPVSAPHGESETATEPSTNQEESPSPSDSTPPDS